MTDMTVLAIRVRLVNLTENLAIPIRPGDKVDVMTVNSKSYKERLYLVLGERAVIN